MKNIDLPNVKLYFRGTLVQGWLNPILNFALLEIESKNNQTLLYNGVPTKMTYIPPPPILTFSCVYEIHMYSRCN